MDQELKGRLDRLVAATERLAEAHEVANGLTMILGGVIAANSPAGMGFQQDVMQMALDRLKMLSDLRNLKVDG